MTAAQVFLEETTKKQKASSLAEILSLTNTLTETRIKHNELLEQCKILKDENIECVTCMGRLTECKTELTTTKKNLADTKTELGETITEMNYIKNWDPFVDSDTEE